MIGRGILVVLDALGIGGAPDADNYGDKGADTLGNITKACKEGKANSGRFGDLEIPNLANLGIFAAHAEANYDNSHSIEIQNVQDASFASATEYSKGKDTPTGHWELAGVPIEWEWRFFKNKDNT